MFWKGTVFKENWARREYFGVDTPNVVHPSLLNQIQFWKKYPKEQN